LKNLQYFHQKISVDDRVVRKMSSDYIIPQSGSVSKASTEKYQLIGLKN